MKWNTTMYNYKTIFRHIPSFVSRHIIHLLKKIHYFRTFDQHEKNLRGHKGEIRTFDKYRKNVYSQNGEDGVTQEILRRLKINKGWFCEFGAWDGKYLSNTYVLISKGWKGVYIEGNKDKYDQLIRNVNKFEDKIYPVCAYISAVGKNSLDNILANTPLPHDFEILSIDIDGNDYFVWKSLKRYRPKVVIVEVNSGYEPSVKKISTKNDRGTSFYSMVQLGAKKGYTPIYHTGNIFFVRKDYIKNIGLIKRELKYPETLFDYSWL